SNNYTNDADGNTLTGGGRTNTWDSQNRMVSCAYNGNSSQYTYGADGIRRRSVVNGVTTDFALDSSMFVRELRSGSTIATYLTGASGPCYRRDDVAGTVRWYLYDGLGSVLDEVDPNCNITANRKYDVYGSVRSSTGTSTSKHKFVGALGHPSDDETGLIYMRARYMDPSTGTFVSEDPGYQLVNWYSYGSDAPVGALDRDGRGPQPYWWCEGLALTGFALMTALLCNPADRLAQLVLSVTIAVAIYCFSEAAMGLSDADAHRLNVLGVDSAIVIALVGAAMQEKAAGPVAGVAIAALFAEAVIEEGFVQSTGADAGPTD
ncbi:MAG TPA: RHS repeat-associated core domain-containing protein, partial [Chthonomonadales bacterium]|nr:RHS repeat-associated core domain-containing protein [Chthonomonadales bacterium]